MTTHSTPFDLETNAEVILLDKAAAECAQRGSNLTEIRRLVLLLLFRSPAGLKAYDLLEKIKIIRANAAPPTVYRALDFLIAEGLAHKIGSKNLFVACRHPAHIAPCFFLICPTCNTVTELENEALLAAVYTSVVDAGFRLETPEIEITAVCPSCQN